MPPPGDGTCINVTSTGMRYLRIRSGPQRNRYVHQLVAEAMLGRELRSDEEVDHKDQNTLNNDWRNLEVKTVSEHAKVTRRRAGERRQHARRMMDQEVAREAMEAVAAMRVEEHVQGLGQAEDQVD